VGCLRSDDTQVHKKKASRKFIEKAKLKMLVKTNHRPTEVEAMTLAERSHIMRNSGWAVNAKMTAMT